MPGDAGTPEGGAGITEVMGRWVILDGGLPGRSHIPLQTRRSVSLLVGKYTWSGEKSKVLFIKMLKISSFLPLFLILFFYKY